MDKIKPQIRQVNENEVLLRDNAEWLHFTNPYRLITAAGPDEVLPALREVEGLSQTNQWFAAGFLRFEAASAFDSALQTHASPRGDDSSAGLDDNHSTLRSAREFPYLWFGLYPEPHAITLPKPAEIQQTLDWHAATGCETYHAAIAKIKDYIAEGQTYQVNYTMRLRAEFTGDAWEFFLQVAQKQNRHAAYVDIGSHVICSASPELFFELDGTIIMCRPMKGTTSRGRTTSEDREQSEWLKNSAKNRAENVMIVDMIRNDLGRIAEIGSVSVPALFETERYPSLWQMTSTISAKTNASVTQIFSALFPCASITGAPKVSTMNIIAELENTPRQIYTGTIGYMTPQRKAKFNVAIRTALIDRERNTAEYGVGGGIVWDSNSRDEYTEALLKSQVLTQQHPFALLETMLWTQEEGFFLHEKHVDRLLDSAAYFDIPLTKETLEEYLEKISSRFRMPRRVRVLLDQTGNLAFEFKTIEILQDKQPLKAGLAKEPVDSSNIFLFHKTTRRDVYDIARKGFQNLDDVLLYNEKGELTEFTIGNLVIELENQLITPPISCGVLAGTFRAHLLETSQIIEKAIPIEKLKEATKVFRVNSLRGWQMIEIQPRNSEATA